MVRGKVCVSKKVMLKKHPRCLLFFCLHKTNSWLFERGINCKASLLTISPATANGKLSARGGDKIHTAPDPLLPSTEHSLQYNDREDGLKVKKWGTYSFAKASCAEALYYKAGTQLYRGIGLGRLSSTGKFIMIHLFRIPFSYVCTDCIKC